ncbi:hypothetical protein [Streptomyces atratus]|uniref:hypothetical protein n=1 Tax=Streptomyces atratus TaxID=1893 RepID=UPI0033C5D2D7
MTLEASFGLAVDEVDFLRGTVHVVRQAKMVGPHLVFAPPKGGKLRDVPLPDVVSYTLAAHVTQRPPIEVISRSLSHLTCNTSRAPRITEVDRPDLRSRISSSPSKE